MEWFEIVVEIPAEGIEIICSLLDDIDTGGVVIDDPALISQYQMKYSKEPYLLPSTEKQVILQKPTVKGYLPANRKTCGKIDEFKKAVADTAWFEYSIKTRIVHDEDWASAWKKYYKPVKVGSRLVIKPSWEDYKPKPGELVVELDPGMAFGTGTHPTTRMCLEVLEFCINGGETVWDVGTGSGILSIAAVKLGAGNVIAIDNDDTALQYAAKNIKLNDLKDRVVLRKGDLLKGARGKANIIVANIIASAIIKLAPQAAACLKGGGLFLSSGIINSRDSEVRRAIEKAGFTLLERRTSKEWVLYAARKR